MILLQSSSVWMSVERRRGFTLSHSATINSYRSLQRTMHPRWSNGSGLSMLLLSELMLPAVGVELARRDSASVFWPPSASMLLPRRVRRWQNGIHFIVGCSTELSCSVLSRLTTGCSTDNTCHRARYVSRRFLKPWLVRSRVRLSLPNTSAVSAEGYCARQGSRSAFLPTSTWWMRHSALSPPSIS